MDIFGIIYKALAKLNKLVTGLRKDVDNKQAKLTYADGNEVTDYKDLKLSMLKGLPFRDTVLIVNDTKEDGHYVTVTTETSPREEIIVHDQDYTIYIKDPVKYFYSDYAEGTLQDYVSACLSMKTPSQSLSFNEYNKLKYCGYIDTMDSSEINLTYCFKGCYNINSIPDYFIQVPVNKMNYAFRGCALLTKLPKLDTSLCTDFSYCCDSCGMYEMPNWDFSNAINMDHFAAYANKIKNINIDIPNVTNANYMFADCNNLTEASISMGSANLLQALFYRNKNLNKVSLILHDNDDKLYINLANAFTDCPNLETLYLEGFSENCYVEDLEFTWTECSKLTEIPDINVSPDNLNPTSISGAFNKTSLVKFPKLNGYVRFTNTIYTEKIICETVQEIPKYNVSSVKSSGGVAFLTPNLTTLGGFVGINTFLSFAACPLLTRDSVLNVFNNLAQSNDTINLHKNTYTKLSEDDIAIAVNRGWTVQKVTN